LIDFPRDADLKMAKIIEEKIMDLESKINQIYNK